MGNVKKDYLSRVAALGCLVCEAQGNPGTPAQLHHPRVDVGGAQRESDWLVVPLCPYHHAGTGGFHTLGPALFWRRYGLTEIDLIARVVERLQYQQGDHDLGLVDV